MGSAVSFRGQSGKAWSFQRAAADAPWARTSGVAIFAIPEACGWRIFRVIELSGKPHDVQPIWALAEAERYGASAVFVALEFDAATRRQIVADLEAGFQPVVRSGEVIRLAA
ncbi:hypothetical protein [Hyphomonas sp.]|jgi:hypothetical protein|uniref:hypothetical protein n=1 Tax=Hyphomonas sp. TaxID=87 RepID=UPI000AB7B691|nr:hypothetical protein [Hyphomonas sp.]